MSHSLTLIVPGDPDQRTGGYLYDARIVDELRRLGWSIEVIGLAGRFPHADEVAARSMHEALAGLADGAQVVIDGLALGGVPDSVARHSRRLELVALVHHPLADETGLDEALRGRLLESEARALAACRRVVVTSGFTARRLNQLGLFRGKAKVIEPGTAQADLAEAVVERLEGREPGRPERLLCVASLTPRKGQDVLVGALAGLADRDWHCVLAGSADRDPAFSSRVARAIEDAGLSDRIDCIGECDAAALDSQYRRATVCLLPSHYEGYGMVVAEALAHGLPLIATTGGALADTVPGDCSLTTRPGDVEGLRRNLARWLDDEGLRSNLTSHAVARRAGLRDWAEAACTFAAALEVETG